MSSEKHFENKFEETLQILHHQNELIEKQTVLLNKTVLLLEGLGDKQTSKHIADIKEKIKMPAN